MQTFIALLILGLVIWFWLDSMRVKEQASRAAAMACRELSVQFLDQTVSLEKLKPARNRQGRFVLSRIYGFDYTVRGEKRQHGRVFMLGQRLLQMQIDIEDGTMIEDKDE